MFPEIESKFIKYVNVDATDIIVRDSLIDILSWSERFIFDTYGISIVERTLTETLDGSGTSKIFLNHGDIASVSSLVVSEEIIPTTDILTFKNSIYYKNGTFIAGTANVTVTYTVGFSDVAIVPSSLINALFVIGRKMYTDETKNFDAYASISSDIKQSVKLIDEIPTLAERLLQSYKIYKF